MKLSDQEEYLIAIPAAVAGDYASARQNLQILIKRALDEEDTITACHLLQTLGDVEVGAGNAEIAHALHEQALGIDRDSIYPLFTYAKSLFRIFRRPDLALLRLNELEELLTSGRWEPSDNDMSREWYERNMAYLRQQLEELEP